ncbi:Dolichyl-phosphate-mannose--protein mannosyltransferase 5 [Candida viswanathii]|uniref:Dolichyl-phosphate-mannose--protein mannosyltransferase n=1 Tax=Candida viswanathii TaxID=5486 RepID=A0A367YJM8_9ASCO|nr:Dolichyl-phosphate-mannose--protein mannosyltransferase 5 [Candida viswanathii]
MSKELPAGYSQGPLRPYYTSHSLSNANRKSSWTSLDNLLVFIILLFSLLRLYKLYVPDRVVFDEIHTIKDIKHYYLGEIFVDVHPPLGKLIYFYISKFFKFDLLELEDVQQIGDLYPSNFPFLWLRLFSGLCGIGHVLLTFLTLKLTCNSLVSFIVALFVCFENSMVTDSRLIMLDGPLLFFQSLVIFNYKSFSQRRQFSRAWWVFLVLTGVSLGLNISTKLSGWFNYIWIGVVTAVQLWEILGDLKVSVIQWVFHIVARIFALLVIPLTIYASVFHIHFGLLPKEGSGSGFLSPHFRSSLQDYEATPLPILFGSTVTIKHNRLEKYLSSHDANYPRGSQFQQVSLYEFPDENNEWVIETKHRYYENKVMTTKKDIKEGAIVRLYHKKTGHYLHVSDNNAPLSEHDYTYEVSCNETRGLLGDVNYEFKLRTVTKKPHSENNLPLIKLRNTETVFQLIHREMNCILMSHETRLPAWGNHQNEVVCVKEGTIPNSLWYIELNSHPLLDKPEDLKKFPRFTFWQKLVEIHKVMFRLNKSFTIKHEYSSYPIEWPFLNRGILFFNNAGLKQIDEEPSLIYYVGNVAVYYLVFLVVLFNCWRYFVFAFINMNPYKAPSESPEYKTTFYANSWQYLLGWAINYLPYFTMERNLYLHHYLSALSFGIMLLGQYLNYRYSKNKIIGIILIGVASTAVIYWFVRLIPIIYGLPWTLKSCLRFRGTSFFNWDIDCLAYTG